MSKYKKKLHVIDLFSGLGGFSQAFSDRGHKVIRYELDERFKDILGTIQKDVLTLTANDLRGADIIVASPPCTCFSFASQAHYWPKLGEPREETIQAIELVIHTLKIIKEANPVFWILENPRGRLRQIIGRPAFTTYWCAWGTKYKKPTDLWGKLPPIDWKMPLSWEPNPSGGAGNAMPNDPYPRDPAKRALIPYDFSLAVCLAVEGNSQQETLE